MEELLVRDHGLQSIHFSYSTLEFKAYIYIMYFDLPNIPSTQVEQPSTSIPCFTDEETVAQVKIKSLLVTNCNIPLPWKVFRKGYELPLVHLRGCTVC